MEAKEGINVSGLTAKSIEAPESFRVVPSGENHTQVAGATAAPSEAMPISMAIVSTEQVKKKRGRPRKYAPDGSLAVALSPMPISASIPLTGGDFSSWKQSSRGRGIDAFKKKHTLEFESPIREPVAYSAGAKFSAHVIIINAGEDVAMKIISFSQQGNQAICVLSANGAISNVTLRQPNSSGGTVTYEGRFELLSLTGSFIPSDNGVTKSRSGGMSVSLAGPDGRVLGGGLAGILLAAGPVQVVVGSFLPGHQLEQYPKKHKFEHSASFNAVTAQPLPVVRTEGAYCAPMPHLSSSASYHTDNLLPVTNIHTKISAPESIYSAAAT